MLSVLLALFPGQDTWGQVGAIFVGLTATMAVVEQSEVRQEAILVRLGALCKASQFSTILLLFVEALLAFQFASFGRPCEWCQTATCIDAEDWCEQSFLE
jgi:hypothetical protein